MDIQDKLKRDYENKSIYTAGFYADPDNDLANRKKLFDVLKSLVENQEATTPFALQIMLTNGEINVMPLGLVDLDELKKYENEQRSKPLVLLYGAANIARTRLIRLAWC